MSQKNNRLIDEIYRNIEKEFTPNFAKKIYKKLPVKLSEQILIENCKCI